LFEQRNQITCFKACYAHAAHILQAFVLQKLELSEKMQQLKIVSILTSEDA